MKKLDEERPTSGVAYNRLNYFRFVLKPSEMVKGGGGGAGLKKLNSTSPFRQAALNFFLPKVVA